MKLALTSDTHGTLKWIDEVSPCDVLVHAGDICPDVWKGVWCRKDLGRSALWLSEILVPKIQVLVDDGIIKHFVATLGNHDWVTRKEAQKLSTDTIHFLVDNRCECEGLHFWGSPWSDQFFDWAWMKAPEKLAPHYQAIPEGIDVIITHQPPISAGVNYISSKGTYEERIGSKELEAELPRIKPKLVVCGHLHSGHGEYSTENSPDTKIINASYLNEQYRPEYPIEVIEL